MRSARWALASALLLLLLGSASAAHAVDRFEIQVYEGDINEPHQSGLEVHTNFVVDGPSLPEPPATVAENHLLRLTLEPSFGLLEWWELGAYLQFAFQPGAPSAHFGGFKLRSKWIVPRRLTGAFIFGLNIEVARGTAAFGGDDWDTEFRPILVWAPGRFMFALNPIVGWALTGPDRTFTPDFEPALKVRVDTGHGFGLGLEYYAGLGLPTSWLPRERQEHTLYLAADLLDAPFELNLAVGRGLTAASNDWTVKAIVGLGFAGF
jgi:hypothetical protein